ncbi:lipopolysaccharide biosynthesis protein [Kitasatospora sp. NPDC101801]|uniref:lipopolysaccharide biosynthesis protein n=1 Tax=Kitasatospora sp. NPDC101801 TaxID=3364103 RepID=UPI0037F1F0A0
MSELRRRARTLTRRWWPVALAVPLGAMAGAGYAVVSHPGYAANSYVVVVPQGPGEGATAVNFAQAYGRLAGQPQVLAGAAAETGRTINELAELVRGTTSPDAPVIEITGSGSQGVDAARAADAVAKSLIAFANTSTKETGVKLVPLAGAAVPDRPATPSAQLDVAVGAAGGLLLGALVLMTRRPRAAGAAEPGASEGTPSEQTVQLAPEVPKGRTETAAKEPQQTGSRG